MKNTNKNTLIPLLFLILLSSFNCDTTPKIKKALFFGIDGIEYGVTQRLIKENRLPNIAKLQMQRAFSSGIEDTNQECPTVSGPNWATIVSGTYLNRHKVFGNRYFQMHISKDTPTLFTHLKQANPSLRQQVFITWDNLHQLLAEQDKENVDKMYFVSDDKLIMEEVRKTFEGNDNPDFVFINLTDLDTLGHNHGYGTWYDDMYEEIDTYLGELMDYIKEREQNLNEDWFILLSSDHGRQEGGFAHAHYPHRLRQKETVIATNIPLNAEFDSKIQPPRNDFNNIYRYPTIASITPTILRYFEVKENLNTQKFDAIPLYGNQGLSKLMRKGEILKWGTEYIKENDSNQEKLKITKTGSEQYVSIYDEQGNLLEKVEFSEGEWPKSETGNQAWNSNTMFRFEHNGVNVWYSKSEYTPEFFGYYQDIYNHIYGWDQGYQTLLDIVIYLIIFLVPGFIVFKLGQKIYKFWQRGEVLSQKLSSYSQFNSESEFQTYSEGDKKCHQDSDSDDDEKLKSMDKQDIALNSV